MAAPKPTPEEKLFAVIQGAKASPIRGKAATASLSGFWSGIAAFIGPLDLVRINRILVALMVMLGFFAAVPFLLQPSVDRLISSVPVRPPVAVPAAPLEGLKPLDEYLPAFLESDPFHVGPPAASVNPTVQQQQVQQQQAQQDLKAIVAKLHLVGISWGESPMAMIEQEQQTYFVKRGEKLGDLTIKEILQDRVIIKKDEQEEQLF